MSGANDKPKSQDSSCDPKSYPPFAQSCRASSLWTINESAVCLVPPPQNCEYVLGHGNHFYCQHPRRQEIVIRTLKIIRGVTP
jgi:hypothetical protein